MQDLGITMAAIVGVIMLGGAVIWVVWLIRPEAFTGAGSTPGTAVAAVEIRSERTEGNRWIAWIAEHPFCMEIGDTEEIARTNVGLAFQMAMRGECKWTPADTALSPAHVNPGWYPDPAQLLGEGSLRYWDGLRWGDGWAERWGPPPERHWDH